jgi:hypothetical protein
LKNYLRKTAKEVKKVRLGTGRTYWGQGSHSLGTHFQLAPLEGQRNLGISPAIPTKCWLSIVSGPSSLLSILRKKISG